MGNNADAIKAGAVCVFVSTAIFHWIADNENNISAGLQIAASPFIGAIGGVIGGKFCRHNLRDNKLVYGGVGGTLIMMPFLYGVAKYMESNKKKQRYKNITSL
jgi:hypothetical protein